MKKILITGANSYIGVSFENYMKQWADEYSVDTVDMIDGTWREKDFGGYDAVFHVAGIAHKKETKENAELYYKVNRDLAIETAKKAKKDGVKQFIFLSSMSVYGMDTGVITNDTVPMPKSNYGKSKLQAEEGITSLRSDNFKVAVLRPPMVYGEGCKGNYNTLAKIALNIPAFPKINNRRSMLYIENLCEFVRLIVNSQGCGVFCPQNAEYVNTTQMANLICQANKKKFHSIRIMNCIISIAEKTLPSFRKAFGSLTYDMNMSVYQGRYNVVSFEDSIIRTELNSIKLK